MEEIEENNKLNFQKLTPTLCDIKSYEESLNFIFNEEDLLNIALTGSYGAGKSSVIKTYEERKKDTNTRFIHISLAHFEEIQEKVDADKEVNENDYNLEKKIINQFVHQVKPTEIPQTRFELKQNVSTQIVVKHTIALSILIVSLIYIFNYDKWVTNYAKLQYSFIKNTFNFTTNGYAYIFLLIVSFGIFTWYLHGIIKMQLNSPILKKIKFQGNEIEIAKKSDESYFDKHLDEILYIFQNSNVDVVVFEDIDRYNNNKIFSKLREINCLINKNSTNKPIRFIYLLRDDIFTSKDRTKFFDFILPIVPILDSSNSYDQILKYFEDAGIIDKFEKTFLERISLYIDDMRILKNIYNEYIVYNSRIQSTELDENKLLAIIIYKNIFPKDFGDLQLNRGFVHNIFSNKEYFVKELKRNIDEKINKNSQRIEVIKREQLNDIDELDALFLVSGYTLLVNNKADNQFESRLEFIKEIKKNPQSVKYYVNSSLYNFNLQDALNKVYEKPEYNLRKEIIEQKLNNGITNLATENEKLRDEKRKLDSSKLKDLITKDNIDVLFTFNIDLNDNQYAYILDSQYYPLIKYLIRNGYINETYFDYLTYFHEKSLSRTDKIFLRSVIDEIAKDATYELTDIEAVVSKLKESDFEKEEILNFNLIDYLVERNHKYLNPLLKQLEKNKRFWFVFNYVEYSSMGLKFIKLLNRSWVELFKELLSNDVIRNKERQLYLINTFYTLDDDIDNLNMKKMNIDNCITSYISKSREFINIDNPNSAFIILALKLLDVSFDDIDYEGSNKELFRFIYRENLYKLNFKMISLILKNIYNITSEDDYLKKNYTLISSRKDEPLLKYVNEHIDEYIKVILDKCADTKITDSEECVISILNNTKIVDIEDKRLYINKLSTVLTSIEKVNESFWKDLLKLNLIKYSANNIIRYYFANPKRIDCTLLDFLNLKEDVISFEYNEIKSEFADINISEFYEEVMRNNKLNTTTYTMILEGFNQNYDEFTVTDIEKEKFEKLIDLNIINMTKDNIEFVRVNYPKSVILFISKNIEQYIKCLDEDILDKEEIMNLIVETNISEAYKINLLEKYSDEISLQKYNFSEEVKLYIIKNKYNANDLGYLIENYAKSSVSMKKEIVKKCSSNIELLCKDEMQVSADLLDEIILSSTDCYEYKMTLIYHHLDLLDLPKIIEYMEFIGMNEFVGIFKGNRPKILINDINDKFLTYFREKKWIGRFYEDKKDSLYYRVIGKNYLDQIEKIESIQL
ncbi:hypothetical protein [Clostridium beijerinckii]|uniref:YobI family P-loop NTPase n=1 Tax=Clostridium beijerinckii TaxID=1520 RepID=UPI00156F033C|nr:hypothetical protein [Clostridium beijerinckii]NRT75150.1 hypothetical protein [Clostridium beijerinckii]